MRDTETGNEERRVLIGREIGGKRDLEKKRRSERKTEIEIMREIHREIGRERD